MKGAMDKVINPVRLVLVDLASMGYNGIKNAYNLIPKALTIALIAVDSLM
jgi:hypothetical protein